MMKGSVLYDGDKDKTQIIGSRDFVINFTLHDSAPLKSLIQEK